MALRLPLIIGIIVAGRALTRALRVAGLVTGLCSSGLHASRRFLHELESAAAATTAIIVAIHERWRRWGD
jgi:hypothetical protein